MENTYAIIYQNENKLLSIYHFKSYQVRILLIWLMLRHKIPSYNFHYLSRDLIKEVSKTSLEFGQMFCYKTSQIEPQSFYFKYLKITVHV